MKKTIILFLVITISFSFGFFTHSFLPNKQVKSDLPAKVTGVAGIFFTSKDPKKLKEWYRTHLGLNTDPYGARFEWQEGTNPTVRGLLQWSPFKENNEYFKPSTKDFMINYRVDNLTELISQLKKEEVVFTDTMETYEYGKFVHIMDEDGNKIELFEPNYAYGK